MARKAADTSLEVEDLLEVAAVGDASHAARVRGLKRQHDRSDTGRADGSWVVPIGRWADAACCFLEYGYTGLSGMVSESPDAATFCIAVLVEVRILESAPPAPWEDG